MLEKLSGVRTAVSGDILRCAGDHDFAAADAAFRTEVDDPVGSLDDVEVVFAIEWREGAFQIDGYVTLFLYPSYKEYVFL